MLKQKRKLIPFILFLHIVVTGLACAQTPPATLDVYDIDRDFSGTGTVFIWAVTNGDEQLASSLLSTSTQATVAQRCQGGKVIACFNSVWLHDWSGTQNIIFRPNDSTGSVAAFQVGTQTGDKASWIVLEEVQEKGQWRIVGWRGLIDGKGKIPAGLVDGTNRTNAFPPDQ